MKAPVRSCTQRQSGRLRSPLSVNRWWLGDRQIPEEDPLRLKDREERTGHKSILSYTPRSFTGLNVPDLEISTHPYVSIVLDSSPCSFHSR